MARPSTLSGPRWVLQPHKRRSLVCFVFFFVFVFVSFCFLLIPREFLACKERNYLTTKKKAWCSKCTTCHRCGAQVGPGSDCSKLSVITGRVQIKECSDRLRDMTAIASSDVSATSAVATLASKPTPVHLFPLLQQLLALFQAFNSAVQPPHQLTMLPSKKRKRKQDDESQASAILLGERNEYTYYENQEEESACDEGEGQPGPVKRQKRGRHNNIKLALSDLHCHHCGETDTPEVRAWILDPSRRQDVA